MTQRTFRDWLNDIPIQDSLRREQARLLQTFLLILVGATLLAAALSITAISTFDQVLIAGSTLTIGILLSVAVAILRRGAFQASVVLAILGLILLAAMNMLPGGMEGSRAVFALLAMPVVLAGLLGNRRTVTLAVGLAILLPIAVAVLGNITPNLVGAAPETYDPLLTIVVFIVIIVVLGVLVDRFGHTLRATLDRAQRREQELETLRQSLEQQVVERTAALTDTVESLRASQATIAELGAPILPVLPGVLVAPLIGAIDSQRAAVISGKILAEVSRTRAHHVIFDITGMGVVDTHIAQVLLRIASAVRLLGAQTMIVGIRPEVAQTMATLNIDLGDQMAYSNLQEAVTSLLAR